MKLSKVLLRWYKSFNTNYSGSADRQGGKNKPWNLWKLPDNRDDEFPFVEIPIDFDITTVVGANESGKSHLLNAISKVVTGDGIPGDPFSKGSKSKAYSQTDLCHFASLLGKNMEIWPHVGVEFSSLGEEDRAALGKAAGQKCSATHVTIILTNEAPGKVARLYFDEQLITLDATRLGKVRECLPRVLFINSQLAIADEVPVADLLVAYGSSIAKKTGYFPNAVAQRAAAFLSSLVFAPNHAMSADAARQAAELQTALGEEPSSNVQLELMLFRDVLGISTQTLENLYRLEDHDRGYAESLIAQWNEEIERELNLSRYWQQDQEFSLRINYKKGILFFEITDKTGCVYTFRERSSGLRYFLSYYIQAKALEKQFDGHDAIILMDEPDSFLSILGQRNLLSIFEALVSATLSKQKTQVVYTTHSPFLINRNFPSRIRLVRKGDGEEGTQYVDQSRVRRFEPVRSALGIDLAQTLFMGGTNILLEGPTDQFLISELIRIFAGQEGTNDLLDLNSIVLVSAESAPGIEQVLAASRWTDEPIPTAIVVVDDDQGGKEVRDRITGIARNAKQMVPAELVALISETTAPFGTNLAIVSTEDIVPVAIYTQALRAYLGHWLNLTPKQETDLHELLNKAELSSQGVVAGVQHALQGAGILNDTSYDKMGVIQELIRIVRELPSDSGDCAQLKSNLLGISRFLRKKIEISAHAEKLRSGKQAIYRIVGDFFIKYKESSTPYELELVFERLASEASSFGDDVDELRAKIATAISHLKKMRDAATATVIGRDWEYWTYALQQIRKNPLSPDVSFEPPLTVPVKGISEPYRAGKGKKIMVKVTEAKPTPPVDAVGS